MVEKNTMTVDLGPLDDMRAKLTKGYYARVGILQDIKYPDGTSVALVGAVQEFGSITNNTPMRSWLRMPLQEKRQQLLDVLTSSTVKKFFEAGEIIRVFKAIGVAAEVIIDEGFSTGGFGQWAPDKPKTIKRKGSDAILQDTALLRKSVTSDVVTPNG